MTRALFLLAGIGARLQPLTDTTPKPLIEIAGRPMLARSVDSLVACGITEFVVVTGHLDQQVRGFFGSHYPGLPVEFIHNDRYYKTNNAFSLLLARRAFNGDGMLLLDGDILYDHQIARDVLADGAGGNCLAIRESDDLGEEEIKVQVDDEGRIRYIGKHLPPTECLGESIGIAKFDADTTSLLFDTLEHRMNVLGMTGEFYEASFQHLIDEGTRIVMVGTGESICMEVDTLEDLETAERLVAPVVDRVQMYCHRCS